MKIRKELIKREIAGDTILVPVGKSVYDANGLFVLNEMATFIWDILPQMGSEEEILRRVLTEYEVEEATAKKDIKVFLNTLKDMGIL